ncbi:MAG: RHS repeat protein, partial [Candidatus Aureabacteria bacterium]|nr:RHS repeat protein [Candidatus Auribacterota bacterium]
MKNYKRILILILSIIVLCSCNYKELYACYHLKTNGGRVSQYGLPMPFADPKETDLYLRDTNDDLRTENRCGTDFTFIPASMNFSHLINIVPKLNYNGGNDIGLGVALNFNSANSGIKRWFFDFEAFCVKSFGMAVVTDTRAGKNPFKLVEIAPGEYIYESLSKRKSEVNYSTGELVYDPNTGKYYFIWKHKNGLKYYFESVPLALGFYRLAKIKDRNGNTITYLYKLPKGPTENDFYHNRCTEIQDSSGRSIKIEYDEKLRVSKIRNPAGYYTHISYDEIALWNISEITFPDNNQIVFGYTNLNRLNSIKTAKGDDFRIQYDITGEHVISFTSPDGTASFSKNERVKFITDKSGQVWKYSFDKRDGLFNISTDDKNMDFKRVEMEDLITEYTDINGNTINWVYNLDNGNVLERTDGNGFTSYFEYGNFNKLTKYTNPMGRSWKRNIDDNGNVTSVTDSMGNVTKYSYDVCGNMISKIDPNGNRTTFDYNVQGDVTKITDPLGNKTIITYDIMGNKLSSIDANGNTTTYQYNNMDSITKIVYFDGTFKSFTYDKNGNKITETDASGNTTRFEYNFNNQLLKTIDALGGTTTDTYNLLGQKIISEDKKGNEVNWNYDVLGRVISESNSAGTTGYSYNGNCGNPFIEGGEASPTTINNKRGYRTDNTYDNGYRLLRTVDAKGGVLKNIYDNAGNITAVTDQNGNTTTKIYDSANKVIKVIDPLGKTTENIYDSNSNIIKTIDANGNETQFVFDKRNKLKSVIDAKGNITNYEYDAVGNRIKIIDAKGNITKYEYDNRNRLIKSINPLGDFATYKYDGVGNKIQKTDENGNVYNFVYDQLNRVKNVLFPDGRQRIYTYDRNSNLLKVEDVAGNIEYTYDSVNRVTTVNNSNGLDTSYTYNRNSLRTSMTIASLGSVNYTYDEVDRLISQTDFDGSQNSFTYDPAGRRTSMTQGNGITTSFSYDNSSRLLRKNNSLLDLRYNYDNVGNILSVNDDTGKTSYDYDEVYRLKGVDY